MRKIQFFVYILLAFSLWCILSIGIGILPLINTSIICDETIEKLNIVFLNLSYSYLAGYIMYFLTVTVPFYRRRKIFELLINNFIYKYYSSALFTFYLYYYNKKNIVDIKENQYVKEFYDRDKELQGKSMDTLGMDSDNEIRSRRLSNLHSEYINFISNMIPYKDYLNAEQLSILNKLQLNNFTIMIESYENIAGISDVDSLFYEKFNEYISLIVSLNKSIKNKDDKK